MKNVLFHSSLTAVEVEQSHTENRRIGRKMRREIR
jgi:hypothetical protein